jgi:16S rRNA processing protein RimM
VRVGRVGRPHGTEGAFVVAEPTERLELLEPGRAVSVGERELLIEWRRGTAERPILKLEGAAAVDLRGEAITVARSELTPLAQGEFLVDDLIGCEAFDGDRRIGRVRDVLLLPAADVLELEPDSGGSALLVPLVADAVRGVDVEAGRIEVDSGFLDAD